MVSPLQNMVEFVLLGSCCSHIRIRLMAFPHPDVLPAQVVQHPPENSTATQLRDKIDPCFSSNRSQRRAESRKVNGLRVSLHYSQQYKVVKQKRTESQPSTLLCCSIKVSGILHNLEKIALLGPCILLLYYTALCRRNPEYVSPKIHPFHKCHPEMFNATQFVIKLFFYHICASISF